MMRFNEAIEQLNVLSSYSTEPKKRQKYKDCIYSVLNDREHIIADLKDFYKELYIIMLDLTYEENTGEIQAEKSAFEKCMGNLKKILSKAMYGEVNIERLDKEMKKEILK